MKQEITNFGRFYSLLKLMPGITDAEETKRQLVWRFTDLRTDSLKEIRKIEYGRMIEYMEDVTGQAEPQRKRRGYYSEDAKLWRKRAIAAVFGFYTKIKEPVTLEYVKAIICRAGSATDINQIPPTRMREIYNTWLLKQKVKNKVDNIVDNELKRYGYE